MLIRSPLVVWLFRDRTLSADHTRRVARFFENHPGPIQIRVSERSVELRPDRGDAFSWHNAFTRLHEIRQLQAIAEDEVIYLLTAQPNENNFFCFEDPDRRRNAVGHVGDYSWVTRAPAEVISAHYVLTTVFGVILQEAGLDWQDYMHQEMRGCFSDFCMEKSQLDFKLRTADICGDCMGVVTRIGVPDELIRQTVAIMESMRRATVSTAPYLPRQDDHSRWPFPVAVTRHKASQAVNATNRLKLLLDHLDCLVRYVCFAFGVHTGAVPAIGERPPLGRLVDALRNLPGGDNDLPGRMALIISQRNLVHLRNETLGHGYSPPDEQSYGDRIERLQTGLAELEETADAFLSAYQLVVPDSISMAGGRYTIDGRQLTGSHLVHPQFRKTLDDSPDHLGIRETSRVYLCNTSMTSFKPLSPHIRYDTCPECRHHRVLLSDGGSTYLDVFGGHRIQLNQA